MFRKHGLFDNTSVSPAKRFSRSSSIKVGIDSTTPSSNPPKRDMVIRASAYLSRAMNRDQVGAPGVKYRCNIRRAGSAICSLLFTHNSLFMGSTI